MITVNIPTWAELWKALALFFYRRWAGTQGPVTTKPLGVPGNRDPSNPCTAYEPRRRQPGDWGNCSTDGHYLCEGCVHRKAPDQEDGI